jgi:hypothetical protein
MVPGGSFSTFMGVLDDRSRAKHFFLYAIQLLETTW